MNPIALQDRDFYQRIVWLDTRRGTFDPKIQPGDSARSVVRRGFAEQVRTIGRGKIWAGAYQDEHGVVLQIDRQHWPLYDPAVSVTRKSILDVVARFRVRREGCVAYSVPYIAGGANPLNVLDATWGLEQYDFFLWIFNMIDDDRWLRNQSWRNGFNL